MLLEDIEWFFYSIDGGSMERINLPVFFRFGGAIKQLDLLKPQDKLYITASTILLANHWLGQFVAETSRMSYPLSRIAATELSETLNQALEPYDALVSKEDRDVEEVAELRLSEDFVNTLRRRLRDFNTVFVRESQRVSAFFIEPKGIYDTEALIEHAEYSLPPDVLQRMNKQAVFDIQQAGKCLAFNIPTAAGMHILKAVESLIRDYHFKVTGAHIPKKSRNWGQYILRLNKAGADPQVTSYLNHIREFYRNPILHPEVTLTPEQALSLFNACLSAIVQLDAAIQSLSAGSVQASPPSASTP